tara:strand:+ start:73 stop:966 length:894 start_codon:yes stop_codon:yes gene_type:complete
MKQVINLEVKSAQELKSDVAQFKVHVAIEAGSFFNEEEFPFKLVVKDTHSDTIHFKWDLFPNCFAEYFYFENRELIIKTNTGKPVLIHRWDADLYGTTSQNLFDIWCKMNPNSKGVAIGTNDGMTGEWVEAFHSGLIGSMLLVEPSDEPHKRLSKYYGAYPNVDIVKALVTQQSDKDVIFYEGLYGNGVTNTLSKDFIKHNFVNDWKAVPMDSVGINELLIGGEYNDLDWLHIDTECSDEFLIQALDFSKIKKPKLIIYEHTHVKKPSDLVRWFVKNGYLLIEDQFCGTGNIALLIS